MEEENRDKIEIEADSGITNKFECPSCSYIASSGEGIDISFEGLDRKSVV